MTHAATAHPLSGLIDLIAERAAKSTYNGPSVPLPAFVSLDIRPSTQGTPEFPLSVGLLKFRGRDKDFVFGNRVQGDMVSQLGYRIYPALYEDCWVVVDPDKKRLGSYPSLEVALNRAEDHAYARISTLSDAQIDELFNQTA
jgi:hypothetical protein